MTGGLVPNYSDAPISPLKTDNEPATPQTPSMNPGTQQAAAIGAQAAVPNMLNQTFVPAQQQNYYQQQPSYATQAPVTPRRSVDFGAPPSKRDSVARAANKSPSRPLDPAIGGYANSGTGQDSYGSQPSGSYTPTSQAPNLPQQQQQQQAPSPYGQQAPGMQSPYGQQSYGQQPPRPSFDAANSASLGGYQQSTYHDGGLADYGTGEASTASEYAEKALKAVGSYTTTAGEAAGNAWGSVKSWLNPESKGLR